MLKNLLESLIKQVTNDLFTYSVVVVDNDFGESARETVSRYTPHIGIYYYIENEQNISLARNKAISNAKGDFVAFIDDDEFPNETWLLTMYKALRKYNVHGVLGPVKPFFEKQPKDWIIKGHYFEKGFIKTGAKLNWKQTRTSNVLMENMMQEPEFYFQKEYGRGGEDMDLFRRLMEKGYLFIWCNDAPVYEKIPPERCRRTFFLRKALLRGQVAGTTIKRKRVVIKSCIAIVYNLLLLPGMLIAGQHYFMKYLEKITWHAGLILSIFKIPVIKDYYVMCTDVK